MSPFNRIHVIGLCGFAGAGKDTVADLLATHAGFRKISFADALRAEVCAAFHVDASTFTERATKEAPMPALAIVRCLDLGFAGVVWKHISAQEPGAIMAEELTRPRSPREILQLWGTQYRRSGDANYWTKQVRSGITYTSREIGVHVFVLPDVRFINEAELVRSFGGEIWQVKRPNCEGRREGDHVSAVDGAAFKPDRIINNAGDIRHLQALTLGEWCSVQFSLPGCRLEIAA